MIRGSRGEDWSVAVAIVLALMVIYNANGREIGSYDSQQPTKFPRANCCCVVRLG